MIFYNCHFCGNKATTKKGTIFVRYLVIQTWENVPECQRCFKIKRHEN